MMYGIPVPLLKLLVSYCSCRQREGVTAKKPYLNMSCNVGSTVNKDGSVERQHNKKSKIYDL